MNDYINMAEDHVIFHIPRCGGTALIEVLKNVTGSYQLVVDKEVDGELIDKVEGENGGDRVVVSQRSKWLESGGKRYIVMRDPVERAVSLYSHWEEGGVDAEAVGWRKKTFEEYAGGDQLESNWVTRALSGGKFEGECTEEMYERAKEVLLSSSLHKLSDLEGVIDAMEKGGLKLVDKSRAREILGRKLNASKRNKVLKKEHVEKLRKANDKDCKLWEIVKSATNFSQ